MKKYNILLFITICLMTMACKKTITSDASSVNNLFTDTIDTIKRNEPLLLSFSNGNNTNIVKWRVLPDTTGYTINPAGIYASLLFSREGVYTVLATTNAMQGTYIVTVSNSLYSNADTAFSLQASQLVNVLPYQSVSFTINNPPSPNGFVWTTTGNVSLANTSSNPALFSFSGGKTGTVKLSVGNKTRSRTIWLAGASPNNPSVDTVPFIFSDKLIITPSVVKGNNGNKLLVLTANTHYNYQCSTDSVLSLLDSSNQQYTMNYGGVVMAAVPCDNIKPATSINTISNMSVGTYPFSVNFGNYTYAGTVTLSAAGAFSFNWTSNNEVSIYPLVVQ